MSMEEHTELVAARRAKLHRYRTELGIEPYGQRVDGLVALAAARALFDEAAHAAFDAADRAAREAAKQQAAAGGAPAVTASVPDTRAEVRVAGRVIQHRDMGKIVFLQLRDHSGDLQVSISKAAVPATDFDVAKILEDLEKSPAIDAIAQVRMNWREEKKKLDVKLSVEAWAVVSRDARGRGA